MRTLSKKGFFWFTVFFVLTLYTLFVSFVGIQGRAYAYAKTINGNGLGQFKHFVVVDAIPDSVLQKLLDKLHIRAAHEEMMCGISDEDAANLSQSVESKSEKVKGNGKEYEIHTPKKHMSVEDFQKEFPNAHCKKLARLELLILLISSHLS